MRPVRDEQGIALISVLAMLIVVVGLGLAILTFANSQSRSGGNQQQAESAYAVAEAALNAQIFQLSLEWPTSAGKPSSGYPASCSASSNATSYCPESSDLSVYSPDSATCPSNTSRDAWSSSPKVSDGWTTYVRDAGATGSSTQSVFTSSTEESMDAYDSSGTGFVWVRAVGTVHCQTAVVIAKVAQQIVSLNFPSGVLNANGFEISNQGNNEILNTQGSSSSSSSIGVRCAGLGSPSRSPGSTCTQFYKSTQVQPSINYTTPASPTLDAQQLAEAKQYAIDNGTYFGTTCPTTSSQLVGAVVYVAGPCNMSITANGTMNSAASPGLLIIVNGTLSLGGTSTFYGVIYDQDVQGTAGDVVTLHSNATVVGGIDVDGDGTVNLGDSGGGSGDLVYGGASMFSELDGFAGAAQVPNTYRQLPISQ